MIGVGLLRGLFLGSIMVWYTVGVWKTVDQYFRDQFQVYLEKEYEENIEVKKDVMMEKEREAAKKALVEKIAKLKFSKSLEEYGIVDDGGGVKGVKDRVGTKGEEEAVEGRGRRSGKGTETEEVELHGGEEVMTVGEEAKAGESDYECIEDHECSLDGLGDYVEPEESVSKWRMAIEEDDEICRMEDMDKKESCSQASAIEDERIEND